MAVVGKTVPITSTSMHVLRRAVHSASVFRPPRPGWNEAFVTPESVELFAHMVERSWQLHPTVAGVFRENRAPPSTDFLRLAQALTQPPDTSTDPSTWAPHPTAADFGFDDHAAVRAVTVAYLQTVRNLTPHAVKGSNIVLRGMLESEGLKGAADGRGIQGRLARVFNLDTAAYILLRRAVSCTTEMAKYPTELHAVWRLFASPDISSDFHFAADHTEALMTSMIKAGRIQSTKRPSHRNRVLTHAALLATLPVDCERHLSPLPSPRSSALARSSRFLLRGAMRRRRTQRPPQPLRRLQRMHPPASRPPSSRWPRSAR